MRLVKGDYWKKWDSATELKELFSFIYKAPFDNGLTEHELDHVMIGYYDDPPVLNPEEAADWTWEKPSSIKEDMGKNPDRYTAWFKIIFDRFYEHILKNQLQNEGQSK